MINIFYGKPTDLFRKHIRLTNNRPPTYFLVMISITVFFHFILELFVIAICKNIKTES